ncbi:MAG: Rab family GTPase [Candidatus Helarchaeales archaeon]
MSKIEPKTELKLILIGDFAVGKTSFINRVLENKFQENYEPTIGVTISDRLIRFKDKVLKLLLWDTTGQVAFMPMTKNFLRDTDLALILYDITRRDTFNSCKKWHDSLKEEMRRKIPCVLVGNKIDLISDRKVTTEEGKQLASQLGIPFMETSVKENINLFETLALVLSEHEKMSA